MIAYLYQVGAQPRVQALLVQALLVLEAQALGVVPVLVAWAVASGAVAAAVLVVALVAASVAKMKQKVCGKYNCI